ncbi:hypothetical protein OAA26_00400 [bacterium]|nr:hypothetical protein [bacterium]
MAKFRKFDPSNKKKQKDRDYIERGRKIKPVKHSKLVTRQEFQWQEEIIEVK